MTIYCMINSKFSEWLMADEASNQPRDSMKSRWSLKYKRSIDCSSPKGFSQKNYCKRQNRGGRYNETTVGTEEVDSSRVEARYARVKDSVRLVRMYDAATGQKLLTNISTIADLASGNAFGVYMSSENKKVIGTDVVNKIKFIYPNDPALSTKLHRLPKKTIMQYIPGLDPKKIQPSDVIRIDVNKHVQRFGDSPAAIIEIASTIVHEATHVIEFEETGQTKDGPGTAVEMAEAKFKEWVKRNWPLVSRTFNFSGNYPFR